MLPSEILYDCFFHDKEFKDDTIDPLPYAIGSIFQSLDEQTIKNYTIARCTFDIFINQLNPSLETDYFSGLACLSDIIINLPKLKPEKMIEIMELAERNAIQE